MVDGAAAAEALIGNFRLLFCVNVRVPIDGAVGLMVDATTRSAAPKEVSRTALPDEATALPLTARIESNPAAYPDVTPGAVFAPPQSPQWVRCWCATSPRETLIANLEGKDGVALSLPLEIMPMGAARVARFAGASHANGNFPFLRSPGIDPGALTLLFNALHSARPDVDLVLLERLAVEVAGIANPLMGLPHVESPNIALAVDLRGGFERVLARPGSRKAKRYRAQTRKFDEAGGARRVVAATAQEVDRLLDAFLEMKAQRFRAMGIANVFGEPHVQAFFRRLFRGALADMSPAFTLEGLEVAGKLRAVTGHSRCADRIICEFGAIADDELSGHSPGDFLFYENINAAADTGFQIYDFSVGDEPYKRLWCDIEIRQFDVRFPLTLKGHVLASWVSAGSTLKAAIKKSPTLWALAKKARRLVRGS